MEDDFLFNECQNELEEAKENMLKFHQLRGNAEMFMYNYFGDIKRQVDLQREVLKFRIDDYSDKIIESLENKQNMTKIKIKKSIEWNKSSNLALLLYYLSAKFDVSHNFRLNVRKTEIQQNYEIDHLFNFIKTPIENIFGRFTERISFDSSILDEPNQLAIKTLCKFPLAKKWQLKYRATRDGFGGDAFHRKCDGIPNTLTVIKSEHGKIFGGFVEKAWSSSGEHVVDPNAFIFSLVNEDNKPFKATVSLPHKGTTAIVCSSGAGPIFGLGDIDIRSGSNTNQKGSSCFGASYRNEDYKIEAINISKRKSILAGSHKFKTLEIEVFAAMNLVV